MTKTTMFVANLILLAFVFVPNFKAEAADPNAGIEDFVRLSFSDVPAMAAIAKCESGFRQFKSDGVVLRGGSGQYVGIFQIDENIHTARALNMGMDILTIQGNVSYAHYLYSTSGTNPWKGCLGNVFTPVPDPIIAPAPSPVGSTSPTVTITTSLNFGQTSPQIMILQKILNRAGFTVAASGPGSVGNETSTFGSLTRAAVMKFQCNKGIICSGSASSTGYGRVGPRTIVMLNQMAN